MQLIEKDDPRGASPSPPSTSPPAGDLSRSPAAAALGGEGVGVGGVLGEGCPAADFVNGQEGEREGHGTDVSMAQIKSTPRAWIVFRVIYFKVGSFNYNNTQSAPSQAKTSRTGTPGRFLSVISYHEGIYHVNTSGSSTILLARYARVSRVFTTSTNLYQCSYCLLFVRYVINISNTISSVQRCSVQYQDVTSGEHEKGSEDVRLLCHRTCVCAIIKKV